MNKHWKMRAYGESKSSGNGKWDAARAYDEWGIEDYALESKKRREEIKKRARRKAKEDIDRDLD